MIKNIMVLATVSIGFICTLYRRISLFALFGVSEFVRIRKLAG